MGNQTSGFCRTTISMDMMFRLIYRNDSEKQGSFCDHSHSLCCISLQLTKCSVVNMETKVKSDDKKHSEQHEEKWERRGETNSFPKYTS